MLHKMRGKLTKAEFLKAKVCDVLTIEIWCNLCNHFGIFNFYGQVLFAVWNNSLFFAMLVCLPDSLQTMKEACNVPNTIAALQQKV